MAKKLTKRQTKIKESVEANNNTSPASAIKAIKEFATGEKFDHTVEIAVELGIDTKLNDQQIRSSVSLPAGSGKKQRIAVVAKGEKVAAAKEAGADFVGTEDLVKKMEEGWMDFDVLVASPDCMPLLGKLGRVLGPRGLMPNPKDGTVTPDVAKAVKELQAGKVNLRAEKTGAIVHAPIGKASFSEEDLLKNFKAIIDELQRVKPSSSKGEYMKGIFLSSSQGPGIKVAKEELSSLAA